VISVEQPAAIAISAAAILVAMPPVPGVRAREGPASVVICGVIASTVGM